jgi:L-aminopeptidase/D-esterase-like protein
VAKLGGVAAPSPGGVGSAARSLPDGTTVGALVVNNALGAIHARDGRLLVGFGEGPPPPIGSTTLVVVATDAPLDRAQCRKLAELGHDALAIGIRPTHTLFDGDVVFTLATGDGSRVGAEGLFAIGSAAVDAVGEAIERSVGAGS